MPEQSVKDLTLFYLEQGTGDPLVLLHGNLSSSLWWEYTLERLDGYHIIAPDLRGRGDTAGDASTWTVPMLADDLHELLKALSITAPVHLVGHSLGSNVALEYALTYPDAVRSLCLLNPGWVAGDMPAAVSDMTRIQMMVDDKSILKQALRGIAAMHPDDENWKRIEAASLKQQDIATLHAPEALKDWQVADCLGDLAHIPTTVVRGAGDAYITTKAVCDPILENLPGSTYIEIENATHSPNIEAPDTWVRVLRDHLESVSER